MDLDDERLADLRPGRSHGFAPDQVHELMGGIYARGDRLMLVFLTAHMAFAVGLAFYHDTWTQTFLLGGGALGGFWLSKRLWPGTFFTRVLAGIAQQAFVALHIYQLYGQSEQHFWYFTAFTMMIVYQDWVCMWPGALLIIVQHSIFAGLHNAGYPVHFFPEAYVGVTKLFYHFGIAIVQVAICGYWAHLLREQTLSDAWRKLQLSDGQKLLQAQLATIQTSEAKLKFTSDALAESSRRQRAILDNVPDAMWVKDDRGRYTAVNDAFCRLFKRSPEELAGRTTTDIVPESAARVAAEQEARAASLRAPVTIERELVVAGGLRILETTVVPVLDAQGTLLGTTGIAHDITERKRDEAKARRAEEQVQHARKLESLGVLAGGIAHDFNNLLAGILGNAELARRELPSGSPVVELCVAIEDAALRAAELTREMLAYSGTMQLDAHALDLSGEIEKMSGALRVMVPAEATLEFDLAADLPLVEADAAQVEQVVSHLFTNAIESLPKGIGKITVRTKRLEISADQFPQMNAPGELTAGTFAAIEVVDSGAGMTVETQRKMFDPFFTTKIIGRGLGLPAVLGIVRGHRGTVLVQSEVGHGTTFRVCLPAVTEPVPAGESVVIAGPTLAAAADRELVLIVDDESAVRTIASRILARAGYSVLTASDGVEGVEMVRQHGETISMVVLDVLMPRLGGIEAMRQMRELVPDLPIFLSSGFTGENTRAQLSALDRVGFLPKPYRMDELVAAVRAAIGARAMPR